MIEILKPYDIQLSRSLAALKKVAYPLTILIVALAGTSAHAYSINVAATGSGWCSSDPLHVASDCADSNVNLNSNTFAGNNTNGFGAGIHRNWFAFDLPTLMTLSSASLYIWNDAANFNTVNPAAVFDIYKAVDLSFAGLINGPSQGSVLVDGANAGPSRYVEIVLNNSGIAALTASLGYRFLFGGNNDDGEQIFGYTNGRPIAYLALDDGKAASAPTPATTILLGLGLAALGFSRGAFRGGRRAN